MDKKKLVPRGLVLQSVRYRVDLLLYLYLPVFLYQWHTEIAEPLILIFECQFEFN